MKFDDLPTTKHILNPNFREGTYAWAEDQASRGCRVMRQSWPNPGLLYAEFTEHSENGRFVIRVHGSHSQQLLTQADKEATDWIIAPEPVEKALATMTECNSESRMSLRQWAIETAINLNSTSRKDLDMQATIHEAEKLMAYVENGTGGAAKVPPGKKAS